jgi:hypothetical protein
MPYAKPVASFDKIEDEFMGTERRDLQGPVAQGGSAQSWSGAGTMRRVLERDQNEPYFRRMDGGRDEMRGQTLFVEGNR